MKHGVIIHSGTGWICSVVLSVLFHMGVAHAGPPPDISAFLSSHQRLSVLIDKPLTQQSAHRYEVYAENGVRGVAVVALLDKFTQNAASFRMQSYCRVALARTHMHTLEERVHTIVADPVVRQHIINIAAAEVRMHHVRRIASSTIDDWNLYACDLELKDVHVKDIADKAPYYVAKGSYRLAKSHIRASQYREALELLKLTTRDTTVYQNAVAFLIPLLYPINPQQTDKIREQWLKIDKIDDPDALIYLGKYLELREDYDSADLTYMRCLDIASGNSDCHEGIVRIDNAQNAAERNAVMNYEFIQ